MLRSGVLAYPQRQPDSGWKSDSQTRSLDRDLLSCRKNPRAGVGRIYTQEGAKLRALAERIVRNRDLAEDVIHDAFVQILRDADTFDPTRGSARGWIYAIVRNTALKSAYRARREIPVVDASLISLCDGAPDATPARDPADRLDLAACLERLEPKRRASVILSIIDGRTHAEIAALLRVPVGTVKAWIRRELIALRATLA